MPLLVLYCVVVTSFVAQFRLQCVVGSNPSRRALLKRVVLCVVDLFAFGLLVYPNPSLHV